MFFHCLPSRLGFKQNRLWKQSHDLPKTYIKHKLQMSIFKNSMHIIMGYYTVDCTIPKYIWTSAQITTI